MGKIRVAKLGDQGQEEELRDKRRRQREEKKKREGKVLEEEAETKGTETVEGKKKTEEEAKEPKAEDTQKEIKEDKKQKKKEKRQRIRSRAYREAMTKVEVTKHYPIEEAVKLLRDVTLSKFSGSVEVHINTIETGIRGLISLPHGTGKKRRVVIADDALLEKIKKGIIDFDVLVAHPSMMAKIAAVAKVLGPKGLMPNPKAGTISDAPEKVAKELEGGKVEFKTETKFPIIHQVIGKMDFTDNQIIENYHALIAAINPTKITSVTLKSTMSPGIKVSV